MASDLKEAGTRHKRRSGCPDFLTHVQLMKFLEKGQPEKPCLSDRREHQEVQNGHLRIKYRMVGDTGLEPVTPAV